jgi:hypothetical protein
MRPAQTPVHAPDQPGRRTPSLLQDLGTVARLYGTVFWMLGQRLQHGQRWEQRLASETLRSYEVSASDDAHQVMRHPN